MEEKRICQVCQKEFPRSSMSWTHDCHGIPFRLVCSECFDKVMEDESLCKELLETLLDIKIKKIVYQKTEESIIPDYESKSIRFDVYVKDGSRIFDVEMQTYDETSIAKRALLPRNLRCR